MAILIENKTILFGISESLDLGPLCFTSYMLHLVEISSKIQILADDT